MSRLAFGKIATTAGASPQMIWRNRPAMRNIHPHQALIHTDKARKSSGFSAPLQLARLTFASRI